MGYLVGIDDYMSKPVDEEEFILKIKALLRRAKINDERKIRIGDVVLDYDSFTVSRKDEVVELPKKEFELLYKLLSYPGKIFTRIQLMDEICKVLLSDMQILVHILKYVVDELKDFTVEEIVKIIPSNITHEPVYPGNRVVKTSSNESIIPGEGLLRFDVCFELDIPEKNSQNGCKIQIDIEAQNSIYNTYEIVTRGITYTSRLISQQFKTVIDGDNYQKLQKSYSIWLMLQAPLKYDGTIRTYHIQEEVLSGVELKEKGAYDKIKIATIYTSSKHEVSQKYEKNDELLRPVMLLFGMSGRSAKEIKEILEKEYGFKMSNELKEGVENMCNLAQGLIVENQAIGRKIGKKEGLIEGRKAGKTEGLLEGRAKEKYEILINLLEQTNISLKQVMKIVGLVKEEEIKEITDKLIADLSLKEGYINGRPTNITIERIIG